MAEYLILTGRKRHEKPQLLGQWLSNDVAWDLHDSEEHGKARR